MTTHGYALNVDLDPAPFTDWITACGLDDAAFTTMARELGRPVDGRRGRPAAVAALAEVFGLELETLPADDGAGLGRSPCSVQGLGRRSASSPQRIVGVDGRAVAALVAEVEEASLTT